MKDSPFSRLDLVCSIPPASCHHSRIIRLAAFVSLLPSLTWVVAFQPASYQCSNSVILRRCPSSQKNNIKTTRSSATVSETLRPSRPTMTTLYSEQGDKGVEEDDLTPEMNFRDEDDTEEDLALYDPSKRPNDIHRKVFRRILTDEAEKTITEFKEKGGFDLETYVRDHVESIAPAASDPAEITEGYPLDIKVSKMEEELQDAVTEQDFDKAQEIYDTMNNMHVEDCGAVLQVNAAFYRAFSKKEYEDMAKLWYPSPTSMCIHPSNEPLQGYHGIMESWKGMFDVADSGSQKSWIECSNVKLTVRGTFAMISCEEEVWGRRFIQGVNKRENELINSLQATNIFRKVGNKWFLMSRHASWHHKSPAAKKMLKGGASESSSPPADGMIEPAESNGLLGNFAPIIISGSKGSASNKKSNKEQLRILGGSLSDLFNGGKFEGGKFEASINDAVRNAQNRSQNLMDEDGWVDLNKIPGDLDDDDDEGVSYHVEEFVIPVNEDDDEEDVESMIQESIQRRLEEIRKRRKAERKGWKVVASSPEDRSTATSGQQPVPAESQSTAATTPTVSLRQQCISAVRKLGEKGLLSPKQKRALLTDIISLSASGRSDKSNVEVAYELLIIPSISSESTMDDSSIASDVEEDFADQCRVFADQLLVKEDQKE